MGPRVDLGLRVVPQIDGMHGIVKERRGFFRVGGLIFSERRRHFLGSFFCRTFSEIARNEERPRSSKLGGVDMRKIFITRRAFRLDEAKERVSFFAASKDDDGLARQVDGGEQVGDVFAGTVVDVCSALLDGATGVALRFSEARLDEGVENRNFAMIELFAGELGAGDVGEYLSQFGVGEL